MDRSWFSIPAVVGVFAFATYMMWPDEPTPAGPAVRSADHGQSPRAGWPTRPQTPPVPGRDVPGRPPMPEMPDLDRDQLSRVYRDAVTAGDPRPGDTAFRATVDAFVEHNMRFAEAQARDEGLTMEEVRELTYFGFLVKQSQMWPEVEELLGHQLDEEDRTAGEELMHTTNAEFKVAMRDQVAQQLPIEERWKLIRETQQRYKTAYFAITGMTEQLLDDMLAGDLGRDYAPSATPPPDDVPQNPDDGSSEPRPRTIP